MNGLIHRARSETPCCHEQGAVSVSVAVHGHSSFGFAAVELFRPDTAVATVMAHSTVKVPCTNIKAVTLAATYVPYLGRPLEFLL
eukprot:6173989-Prymnesium_polylepis.1